MNGPRASLAIARRGMSTEFVLACLGYFVVGAGFGLVPNFSVSSLVFWTAFLATFAPKARDIRDLTLFAAPLYGRQLARALAIPPCVAALAFPAGALLAMLALGRAPSTGAIGVALMTGVIAALVSLSGAIRTGNSRMLYQMLAVPAALATALPVGLALAHGLAISLGVGLIAGFVALRAFGETLARYDPID